MRSGRDVVLRDSRNPGRGTLTFPSREWLTLLWTLNPEPRRSL